MNTSTTTKIILPLLLEVQREAKEVQKDSVNPFYNSSYADLNSVIDACKDLLNQRKILVLQPVGHDEHGDYVETMFIHTETGEYVSSQMRLVPTSDAQKQGGAITYARRYALKSFLFMKDADDDGNTVQGQEVKKVDVSTPKAKEDLGKCEKCGAPNALSQAGNTYCSAKCWLK